MIAPFEKIVIDKKEEAKFRRRALRKFPSEYMEALWGQVRGNALYICAFMKVEHDASKRRVHYEHEELDFHEEDAAEHGYQFLGTIHTHPEINHGLPSQGDIEDSQETQESVMAICAIETKGEGKKKRRRCIMEYWPTVRPLTVVYKDWDAEQATSKAGRGRATKAGGKRKARRR